MALTQHAVECDKQFGARAPYSLSPSDSAFETSPSSSWSMELSRWRVRLRRLKRWSRYEGRASDGQFDTHDVPEDERLRSASDQAERPRHSLPNVKSVAFTPPTPCTFRYEHVVPPVCIPKTYRQQDRQRGVRVGGDRVPFTLDGHRRRRRLVRPMPRIDEAVPLELDVLPDMRNSMASVYARMGRPTRSRRAKSV